MAEAGWTQGGTHSKQPFAFAFYPVGLEGRQSRAQLPITCFQAPTSPQKGALTGAPLS